MLTANPQNRRTRRLNVLAGLIGATLVLLAFTAVQRTDVPAPSPIVEPVKLTSALDDLSRSVPQEQGDVTPLRVGGTAPLTLDALPKSVQDAMRGHLLRINENNEVQVYILLSEVTDEHVRQLTAAGATIEIRDAARRRVQARVPVSRLQLVAQLPIVDAVRLPTYARHRVGSVTSEGDAILHADQVRQQLSLDGTGVRVGVVSDGLKGVFATGCTTCAGVSGGPISTGDLPTASGVRDSKGVLTSAIGGIVGRSFQANGDLEGLPPASPPCGFAGAGAEGTALLEIVHDLAPGAKLSFANGDTDMAFAQAVNFLAASNDIVLDDIGFFGEPYDGSSAVSKNTAAALNNPAYPIRAYFTSVGNDADEHYYGTYVDSGIDGTTINGITTSGHLHVFQRTADTTDVLGLGSQPYNLIQLPQNGEVAIFLTWDDAFGGSGNNYDLYLVQQSTGRVVAKSTDVQNGKQDPVESIDYVNTGGQDFFRVVVQNVQNAAQPKHLNIFSFQPECARGGPQQLAPPRHERHNYNTAAQSVSAQSDAGGSPVAVVAVGAICSASGAAAGGFSSGAPDESCLDTSNSTIEFFSSRGPTLDGRLKPDISAIDGVSITGSGGFGSTFFGTSAAVPHMGGIAALLLQSAPCLLNRTSSTIDAASARFTIRNLILGHAAGLSNPSPDNTFGAGRADALAAVNTTLPAWKGSANLTVDGNTPFGASLTPAQVGFSDPNQCSLTRLSWTGGCSTSPGATMICPFGSSSVSVSASNNGVGFSSSTDLQITVTDYSLGASPGSAAVSAGRTATYAVSVSPQNGPYQSAITLSCANGNLPPQANCSFDPPTVTPGAAAARSTLTISTAASSLTPPGSTEDLPVDSMRVLRPRLTTPTLMPTPTSTPTRTTMVAWLSVIAMLWVAARRTERRRVATAVVSVAFACVAGQMMYGDSAGPAGTVALSASEMASGIAVFPSTLTFGTQTVGTTTPPQLVSVTNIGADTLNFSGIGVSAGDFSQVNSCGTALGAGASCAVAVSFTPTAAGARTGTLGFVDDASGSPHTVSLAGTGQAAPSTSGGTPAGTYVVTISGVSGTLTHTAGVTLVVQ